MGQKGEMGQAAHNTSSHYFYASDSDVLTTDICLLNTKTYCHVSVQCVMLMPQCPSFYIYIQ